MSLRSLRQLLFFDSGSSPCSVSLSLSLFFSFLRFSIHEMVENCLGFYLNYITYLTSRPSWEADKTAREQFARSQHQAIIVRVCSRKEYVVRFVTTYLARVDVLSGYP